MASGVDEENDAVLSDLEADDPLPIGITTPEEVYADKLREILGELDRERAAKEAAENARNELQDKFNRLKVLCHEAIKKRDESSRQRDDALREKDEALKRLETVNGDLSGEVKVKEEALKQKDEVLKQLEELGKAKESMRVEMETGSSMLVSGMEKMSRKVSIFKDFGGNGLPKSNKYTGLPAVAYGVIKRTNEIIEELVRQIESSVKSRNEARDLVEQRNYEIAIEVSQLEATISELRDEVAKKSEDIEGFKRAVDEKSGKVVELQREYAEKVKTLEDEVSRLQVLVSDYDSRFEIQKPLLAEQLNLISRVHEEMCLAVKMVDVNKSSELSESLFLAQETNMEENIKASLEGMGSVYELSKIIVHRTRDLMEDMSHEVKSLNETVSQLVKEKEQIGSLLRSTLSKRMSADLSSKTNELFKAAENGLREAGIDYKFSRVQDPKGKAGPGETEDNEVYALANALENIIKQSQIEIIELKHSLEELRAEANLYKNQADAQAKELNQCKQHLEELEEKERVANENIEGLMLDIATAEEEITRWKMAAQQEAEAGKSIEQEYGEQLAALRQEFEEARQAVIESEKKLKFKEETAQAAITARDAAEKSLRLADMRATRLRERVEELTHQLDELDTRDTSRTGLNRPRYVCWPWQWLGLDYSGVRRVEPPQLSSANEMELSEPLI